MSKKIVSRRFLVIGVLSLFFILTGCSTSNDKAVDEEITAAQGQEVVDNVIEKATGSETPEASTETTTETTTEASTDTTTDTSSNSGESETQELQKYIDIELVDKDGNPASISDYEGKFIALNFFGVWCKYCMEEMPDLQEVYSEYEGDDFVILLVNATTTENIGKEGVKKWYEDGGYTMPMIMDLDGKALEIYPVSGFPTTYFIDKQGYILGAVPGMLTKDMLLEILATYNK